MIKVIALHQSQGFRGKYWAKDETTEVAEGEDFPKEHFGRQDGKPWEDDKKSEKGKPKAPPAGDPPADDKK